MPDQTETVFTAAHDREVRVSGDRQTITHRAMAWSGIYTPAELVTWLAFYERMNQESSTPQFRADLEVLHAARDLLAREGALP